MARVPITVMGCRCERCDYEWIPQNPEKEPVACPRCHSPYWNKPKRNDAPPMTYPQFRDKIAKVLKASGKPMTWTEVRTEAGLPQLFPNNQWVRRMDNDIGLIRRRDSHGITKWELQ